MKRRTRKRIPTRPVMVGGVGIGGAHGISVQSMTNTDTADIAATVGQIKALEDAGCDIARIAVPDMEAAAAIPAIKRAVSIPIVADIHFDYRLALESIRNGVDKVRINPGNIGGADNVRKLAEAARARGIPIRVGVNAGSLERGLLERHGGATAAALAESALAQSEMLNLCGFYDIVVSLKASDVFLAVDACRLFAKKNTGLPQHVGMTEAGTEVIGAVRSAIGISSLLRDGIGDTVRVSLTGDPVQEVLAARELLRTLGLREGGVRLISCPTCGRCKYDLVGVANEVGRRVSAIRTDRSLTVAVMGCAVNGPGEAREADVGVAGGVGKAVLFRRGELKCHVPEDRLVEALMDEIADLL
ncbi:MAG: flavodoxin-dependent (E)-4-hydroxy-3-methylbut-2-enyl-diphosphate synthase, partial [Clostridiales bacterium]|nr:flavodoxin-dependent (E)-4-hydroxy-3-methylbut-2-enyl-diphosphate synthase [Clostridiales bacterium]